MHEAPTVRRADDTDVGWIAPLLASALGDMAWPRWTVSADEHRVRVRALYRLYVERIALPFGEVHVDAQRFGVAAWTRSDAPGLAEAQAQIGPAAADLAGDRIHHAIAAERLLAPLRPAEPHWFLQALAVAPPERRRGVGSALLAPRLERCAAERLPAAVESSEPPAVAFYERLGFVVREEVRVPEGGPPVWMMWRP